MPTPLIMPKFEMTQEYGTLIRWLAQEGDWVEKGEPVLEVETDKVVMEVEAPASGYLREIQAQAGERVAVTQVIANLYAADEITAETPAQPPAPPEAQPPEKGPAQRESPLAKRVAQAAGIDIHQVPAATPGGRVTRQDVENYLAASPAQTQTMKPRATPAARRVAREQEVDLASVEGSGPRRRVQEIDVRAFVERDLARAAPPGDHRPPETAPAPAAGAALDGVEIIQLEGMRRTIAERLQRSYQTAPHVTFTREVDMSAVNELRAKLNERLEARSLPRISVTAVLVRVCAWALARHPRVNASLVEDQIYRFAAAHIGVAVALDEGLIVPVIHNAGRLGLAEISAALQDLSERARGGRLTHQEVTGGTFTISNLGMFGIDQFTAILNPPQAAILAVGRTVKRPVVVEEPDGDRVVVRPMMQMTLSADHRIVDGAVAAQFLQDVAAALETPNLLLL